MKRTKARETRRETLPNYNYYHCLTPNSKKKKKKKKKKHVVCPPLLLRRRRGNQIPRVFPSSLLML
jgi:hypothetical protein